MPSSHSYSSFIFLYIVNIKEPPKLTHLPKKLVACWADGLLWWRQRLKEKEQQQLFFVMLQITVQLNLCLRCWKFSLWFYLFFLKKQHRQWSWQLVLASYLFPLRMGRWWPHKKRLYETWRLYETFLPVFKIKKCWVARAVVEDTQGWPIHATNQLPQAADGRGVLISVWLLVSNAHLSSSSPWLEKRERDREEEDRCQVGYSTFHSAKNILWKPV